MPLDPVFADAGYRDGIKGLSERSFFTVVFQKSAHKVSSMALKFLLVLALLGVAHASHEYSFAYDVQDPSTGDYKSQHEVRNGDVVQGQYSLVDADGTQRIVDYSADAARGFNAIVRKQPLVKAVPTVQVAQPVAAIQPQITHYPIQYPIQHPFFYTYPSYPNYFHYYPFYQNQFGIIPTVPQAATPAVEIAKRSSEPEKQEKKE